MSAALHLIVGTNAEAPCAAPPRALVVDLTANERIILWAFRLLAESRGNWGVVQQELWLCCGMANVEAALQALEDLLAILMREGRRPMLVKPSDARRMNACEESLVALISAGCEGDDGRLAAHARWLVRPLAQGELIGQALRLGQAFPCGRDA